MSPKTEAGKPIILSRLALRRVLGGGPQDWDHRSHGRQMTTDSSIFAVEGSNRAFYILRG